MLAAFATSPERVMTTHETLVVGQFGSQAKAYLESAVHAAGADLDLMSEIVGERPEAVALDMGCGGGHVSFRLAPHVRKIVASDLSREMLEVVAAEASRRGLANLETAQSPAESLPFPSASFDFVATRYSAHHWRDLPAGMAEMRRVLKPGGLAIFMDAVAPEDPLLDTWLQSLELLRDASHVRDASVTQLESLLSAAGFGVDRVARLRVHIEFAPWIARMKTPEAHVAAIRSLQQLAPAEVARHFEFEPDGGFMLDTAVIAAAAR